MQKKCTEKGKINNAKLAEEGRTRKDQICAPKNVDTRVWIQFMLIIH